MKLKIKINWEPKHPTNKTKIYNFASSEAVRKHSGALS